jgi:endonuclease/exonuclease/phosphatase family metal-dependent hydrolase
MRIGTYNILGFTGYPADEALKELGGPSSPKTVAYFAGVIRELACDILVLEEGTLDQAMLLQLAKTLGMSAATIPAARKWPVQLLTHYPILESRAYSHIAPGDIEPHAQPFSRAFGAIKVKVEGSDWWFVGLHRHPSLAQVRQEETRLLMERVDELGRECKNIVILGDFNGPPSESYHDAFRRRGFVNAMEKAGGGVAATADTYGLKKKNFIDHIYLSRALAPYLTGAQVVRGPRFRDDGPARRGFWVNSDHLPVLADLTLPGKAQKS